jgi:hypothetical protein
MRRFGWAVLAALIGACGRIGFDPTTVGGVDAPAPVAGLVAWWKLDDGNGTTAADSVGSADGSLNPGGGSVTPVWTTGIHGGAVHFQGDGDDISIGPLAVVANLPALTISGWVRPSAIAALGVSCVLDKGDGAAGWAFNVNALAPGDIAFYMHFATGNLIRFSAGGLLNDGTWSHVVVTWDGTPASSGIRLFVDGSETAYASATEPTGNRLDDASVPIEINCNAGTSLAGDIDDVKLFGRALSTEEVSAL